MTDFGGVSIKEMSQDVKDALLDPNALRTAPVDAANPIATIADIGGGMINAACFQWAFPAPTPSPNSFGTGPLGFDPKFIVLVFNQGRAGSLGQAFVVSTGTQRCIYLSGDGGHHQTIGQSSGDTFSPFIAVADDGSELVTVTLAAMSAAGIDFIATITSQTQAQYFKLWVLG